MVAAAVLGAAVIGGVASNQAAKKSANATNAGLKQTGVMAAQSSQNAIDLFAQGRDSAQAGIGGALDFYKNAAPARNQPIIQGSTMGQQVLGQGGIQANNAILGLPVDMSFANNPQQVTPDYSAINNATLPQLGASFADRLAAKRAAEEAAATQTAADNKAASAKAYDKQHQSAGYILNPMNQGNNLKYATKKVLGRLHF